MERISIGIEQLSTLIRINAFRFTGCNKRQLLWQAHFKSQGKPVQEKQEKLFEVTSKSHRLPELSSTDLEDTFDQLELLGFTLSSPFSLLKDPMDSQVLVRELPNHLNKMVKVFGYLVSIKNTSTQRGARMNFGTFLDSEGQFLDTTHFPMVAANYPFRGKGIYAITGRVVEEFGFYSLEVFCMEKLAYVTDPRFDVEYQIKK